MMANIRIMAHTREVAVRGAKSPYPIVDIVTTAKYIQSGNMVRNPVLVDDVGDSRTNIAPAKERTIEHSASPMDKICSCADLP